LTDLGVDEEATLKWISEKQRVKVWVGLLWLRTGSKCHVIRWR